MKSVVGVMTPVTFQFESAKLKFLHLFWCPKFLLAQLGQKNRRRAVFKRSAAFEAWPFAVCSPCFLLPLLVEDPWHVQVDICMVVF